MDVNKFITNCIDYEDDGTPFFYALQVLNVKTGPEAKSMLELFNMEAPNPLVLRPSASYEEQEYVSFIIARDIRYRSVTFAHVPMNSKRTSIYYPEFTVILDKLKALPDFAALFPDYDPSGMDSSSLYKALGMSL